MSPWLSDLFLSSQSDERLVSLAGAGHDRAFAVIVERYRPELHAHARGLSSDGRAEDIVQQTFLSAFTALRSGTEVQHLRGWLHQIARNAATRVYGSRDASLDEVSATGEPLEDVAQERALALNALSEVSRLPDRQREALVGTVQGRRRAEIARSMGLSEGAVRQLVHRARMSVRAAVTAVTPFPLARWFAARSANAGPSEVAMSAGAAAAGGATMKLGALLASGVIAGGIVVGAERTTHAHHAPARGVSGQASSGAQRGASAVALSPGARGAGRLLGTGGALGATLPAALRRGGAAGGGGHEGSGGADRRGPVGGRGETRSGSHDGDDRSGGATGDGGGPGPSGTGEGRSGVTSGEGSGGQSGSGSPGGPGRGEDSGAGTSGSGTSGSGTSGSGTSGSGTGDSGSSGPGRAPSVGTTPDGGGSDASGESQQTAGTTTLTGRQSGKTSGSISGSDSSSTADPASAQGASGSGDGSGETNGGHGGHGG